MVGNSNTRRLRKSAKAVRVNHTSFVALTANKFAQCSPDFNGMLELVAPVDIAVGLLVEGVGRVVDRGDSGFANSLAKHVDLCFRKDSHNSQDLI